MTTKPLEHAVTTLNKRFGLLAHKISQELGLRGNGLTLVPERWSDGRTAWRIVPGAHALWAGSGPEGEAIVRIASSPKGTYTLSWGYTEIWGPGKAKKVLFVSSRMRFFSGSTHEALSLRPLRLEWEGPEVDAQGHLGFPGDGAAHPHWQIGAPDWEEAPESALLRSRESEVINRTKELFEREKAVPPVPLAGARRWLQRLHLPARAHWIEAPCDMDDPTNVHVHPPGSLKEIDNWIISALRYTRHEFHKYA